MTKKKIKVFNIKGKGSKAEMNARMKRIETGKERLPDGSDYSKSPNEFDVRLFWDETFSEKPFKDKYFKAPKASLDLVFRTGKDGDSFLPLAQADDKKEIEWELTGGLNSLDLTFSKSRIFQAIQRGHSEASLPDGRCPGKISVNYPQLYRLLGIDPIIKADGRKVWPEGKRGQLRKWLKKELRDLNTKSYAFIAKDKTGEDKKGKPLYSMIRVFLPLIRIAEHYKDVRQRELPGLENPDSKLDKRFSHFDIYINRHAQRGADSYFRYLPSALGKEISDYRKSRGQRPSAQDINFINYLYLRNEKRHEINCAKLAGKLKIKYGGKPKRLRNHLDRIYEMALDLKFLLKVEKGVHGLRATKEIFHLNPERFPYLENRGV